MIGGSNIICIVSDDLTGANDTALQFQINGADTNILLNKKIENAQPHNSNKVWAISTESRNISLNSAYDKVKSTVEFIKKEINPDYYYKKIDSTMRGNIAIEVLAMLEILGLDCAIIMPAFPQQGRITVGGYHLLNGIPLEQTEMARDPHSPISESHLPTLLKNQIKELENLIGEIGLKTVLDGAREIYIKINNLIEDGKKIIIADSISQTDLEQIVLAIKKSNYKILPAGNAAAAKILANDWFPKQEKPIENKEISLPKLPKLIVSGSATQITANQIAYLASNEQYKDKVFVIELNVNTILNNSLDELVDKIEAYLSDGINVLVHTSYLFKNFDGFAEDIANANLTKATFASRITDFLAQLTKKIFTNSKATLVTLGGETSYKCCDAIGANQLKLLDEVLPAIALSKNTTNNQLIVTKSGNLGDEETLVKILQYFEQHEKYYE